MENTMNNSSVSGGCCKKCGGCQLCYALIMVGGINWGLVGLGGLMGSNLNLVNLLVGSWPTLESIVYIAVGAATVSKLLKLCKCCKK